MSNSTYSLHLSKNQLSKQKMSTPKFANLTNYRNETKEELGTSEKDYDL